MGTTALTLAELSAVAYTEAPVQTLSSVLGVSGFRAVNFETLHTTSGVFHNENAAATVMTGAVNGQNSVILSFRGTDDPTDWQHDFLDINADYAKFGKLFGAVDAYAAAHHMNVVVTGHSLGGSLVQNYMAQHQDTAAVSYEGVSFGSPGANIPANFDPRVTDYLLADDPIALAGLHRQEIASAVRADPTGFFEQVVGDRLQGSGLPLTDEQLHQAADLALQQGNYHNTGTTVLMHSGNAIDEVATALQGNFSAMLDAHDIRNYIAVLQADPSIPDPGSAPQATPSSPVPDAFGHSATELQSLAESHSSEIAALPENLANVVDAALHHLTQDFFA